MQPQMRGVWGVAQLFVALGAAGWAYFQTRTPTGIDLELFWPMCTLVGAVFLGIAALLFFRGHPDGRVVALFGLLFIIASGGIQSILSVDRCTEHGFEDGPDGEPVAKCNPVGATYVWAMVSIVAIFTLVEVLLLVGVGRKPRSDAEPDLPI